MNFLRLLIVTGLLLNLSGAAFSKEKKAKRTVIEETEDENQEEVIRGRVKGILREEKKKEEEAKKEITETLPLLEIKRLETEKPLYSIELRGVALADFFRIIAHDYDLNILIDKDVKGEITASLTNISLDEAIKKISDMHGLIFEKNGNVIIVKPYLITKVFILKHIEAKTIIDESIGQAGKSVSSKEGEETSAGTTGKALVVKINSLLSPVGKVLLGKQHNSIMVIDHPENVDKVREYLEMADKGMSSRIFKLKYINAKEVVGTLGEEDTSQ